MVMTMNSWVLPINSWLGFSKKAEFWGYKLCQKLKNLCSNLIMKSEFHSSKPNLSYEWFSENKPWTSHVFMGSIHEIMDITLFPCILSIFLWVGSSSNEIWKIILRLKMYSNNTKKAGRPWSKIVLDIHFTQRGSFDEESTHKNRDSNHRNRVISMISWILTMKTWLVQGSFS